MAGRNTFKLGLIQMDSQDDRKYNLLKAEAFAEEAVEQGADMVMFPETMEYIGDGLREQADVIPGPMLDFFSRLAVKHGIYVHGGTVTEKLPGQNPRNTSILVNPQGKLTACYSKLHMFDIEMRNGPAYQESRQITAGSEIVLADTQLARMGFAICFDIRYPELFRMLAKNGAQVLFVAANFTHPTGLAHWEPLLRARAIENACYVAACGQTGQKKAFQAHGHSMVIDPWGTVVGELGDEEGCLVVPIDLERVADVRRQVPAMENIREDVYSLTSTNIKVYEE